MSSSTTTAELRTALVTGASRGIGLGIATSLARQGFGLTLTSRSASDLKTVADNLSRAGAAGVVFEAADMTDAQTLPALVELHDATYASMNALVVNAGVGTAGRVVDFPLHRVAKTLAVNFTSAMILIQHALPLLRRAAMADSRRGARIVALSSITGAYPEAGLAVYGASKAALMSLTETVNLEESAGGVMATALAPAYVETDMSAWVRETIPAHQMIPVADVVALVDLLLRMSRATSISRVVMGRSGTSGYTA